QCASAALPVHHQGRHRLSDANLTKPAELAARAIEYSSKLGENILDVFGGLGSTLIAAAQTGQQFLFIFQRRAESPLGPFDLSRISHNEKRANGQNTCISGPISRRICLSV